LQREFPDDKVCFPSSVILDDVEAVVDTGEDDRVKVKGDEESGDVE
jgi:hypothetical protein